ncbi:MAG: Uma2 family endonuclease, partial [Blastocatellia bacterium]
ESPDHSIICSNINAEFNTQLRGKSCTVYSPNMKLHARGEMSEGRRELFAYPDVLVVCGRTIFHDEYKDVIVNPKVVVEVLSPSTSRYDHEEKFDRYAENKTLTGYLLVSQKSPHIQHFVRKTRGRWESVIERRLSASIMIPSIGCRLRLADVYDRIDFSLPEQTGAPIDTRP